MGNPHKSPILLFIVEGVVMFSTVISGAVHGITPYIMHVEVDASDGLPSFNMVGYLSSEVREASDRVKVALKNSGFKIPAMHVTVNLSPAGIRKEGVALDLPIAIGMLASLSEIDSDFLKDTLFLGELGLDGEVKPVRGVLPIARCAKENGIKTLIIPYDNAKEGAVVQGIKVIGVKSLPEVVAYISCEKDKRNNLIEPTVVDIAKVFEADSYSNMDVDFADINGQSAVKRAVEVAAAGFHHLLMIGPPGSGKSMVAKRIPTILPPLSEEEALEVSTIYSVSGMLDTNAPLMTRRPFMNPHHSITETALTGGGMVPKPGVISRAHRGVLFLDELAEFKASTLDILRQPIEDKKINIARANGTFTYPSDFQLVCATNPCKCGYYPDMNKCRCTEKEIKRYLSHISGPILDRIDICVEAPKVDVSDLNNNNSLNESSKTIRERVLKARKIQEERFKGTRLKFNSDMSPNDIKRYCGLGMKEKAYIERIFYTMDLSARAYHRTIRVARTIADLDGSERIKEIHLTEAVCYRMADSKYWNNSKT